MQPDPQVRLRSSFLLHIDLVRTTRPRERDGAPQGRPFGELSAELLGDPDLPRLHVRLDSGCAEHGFASGAQVPPIGRALARLHLALAQREAKPRLPGSAIALP